MLRKFVRQLRPTQEKYVAPVIKIQSLLTEADTGFATLMEKSIVVAYNIKQGMSEEDAMEEATQEFWPGKKGGSAGYQGGRIRKAPGGIMNLGGMEKDYRTTGGFVPIGAYEKKDDVPARLSKNEFVMTADAVRAAGGGSINKGAQLMYDTMKNLEASPQSKRMTA